MDRREELLSAYALLNEHAGASLAETIKTLPVTESVRASLQRELWGWGPIQSLIDNTSVTEIIVNGPESIFFEYQGQLQKHEVAFLNESCYRNFILFVSSLTGSNLTVQEGFAQGFWNQFRIHFTSQCVTRTHDIVTLRRANTSQWNLEKLAACDFLTPRQLHLLELAVRQRQTVLVCGPTSSGKTSLLSALLAVVPQMERMVILEETSELHTPNSCSLSLEARPAFQGTLPEISLERLVKESLRMRPDRLVVGEVRGAEAKDLVLALSTGHTGGFATIHARSAADALQRLEVLVQLGAPTWALATIRKILFSSIQMIATATKSENGERRLKSLHKVVALEDHGLILENLD